jgi:hypothetical protein
MPVPSAGFRLRRHSIRRIGRALVLATQLAAAIAPLAEAHGGLVLRAHVEAPRTVPHPGQQADACPACMLLSVHGCPAERPRIEEFERQPCVVPQASVSHAVVLARVFSNASRAPPLSV